ncbi:hypothetical protein C487_09917 [Natrinema pallidum DSM 3751]|uniref:Uncharacterized protein n=1 Tax=Natrinema pallidum DSM 3751 TaxID=1227495 RepID=L9YV66_9EURY|nr:hypothetical protein C487_09917 [Natrinema pallidum DSM 3751]
MATRPRTARFSSRRATIARSVSFTESSSGVKTVGDETADREVLLPKGDDRTFGLVHREFVRGQDEEERGVVVQRRPGELEELLAVLQAREDGIALHHAARFGVPDGGLLEEVDARSSLVDQSVDPPLEQVGEAEQPERTPRRRGVEDDAVVGVRVPHHVDEAVEQRRFVGPGGPVCHLELTVDLVDHRRRHLFGEVLSDLVQVAGYFVFGIDLHRVESADPVDRPRGVVERLVEHVGDGVGRVGRDDEGSLAVARTAERVRTRDGRLADAALAAEEDERVHQK